MFPNSAVPPNHLLMHPIMMNSSWNTSLQTPLTASTFLPAPV